MSYNNGKPQEKAQYLRASSVTKTIHSNTQEGVKERAEFSFDQTEEVSITLTHEKANELISRLQSAMADESGTGGVRISMYGRKSENKHTGEIFDGLGILIYAQKPPQNGFKGKGSFQGNSQGRRQYPQPQGAASQRGSQTYNQNQQRQASQAPKPVAGIAGPAPRNQAPTNGSKPTAPKNSNYDEPNF